MVSRREFVKSVAAASGAAAVGLKAGAAGAQDAPKKGGTLRVGFYVEAATMDPHLSGSKVDRQVYHNVYEPLVVLDRKLGIKPGLAESWTQPDPKTLVFKLRRGVKFHDGTDFNAEAAKFNFDRMKTEPKSVRKGEVANIDSVDVVDSHTIKVNLKKPDAALLATLTDRAGMMVSPKVVQERGGELGRNAKGAGTGPFEFVEWVKDSHLVIKRNDGYWNKQGGPYLDRVRYRPIPDDDGQAAEPAGRRDRRDRLRAAARRGGGQGRQEPRRRRRALARRLRLPAQPRPAALQREGRCARRSPTRSTSTRSSRACGSTSACRPTGRSRPPSWAYDKSIPPIKRDLAKAKAKLAEGGKAGGFDVHADHQQPADQRAGGRGHAGPAAPRPASPMKIKLVDSATLISDGNAKNFEMISYQWSGRPDPDGNIYQFFRTTPGTSFNWSGISNPQLDALLDRTREVSNQAERKKLYSEVTKILQDELPMVFIVHPIEPKAFSPKVQGYEPIPDGMMRFKDVWLR